MKLSEAGSLADQGRLVSAELLRNPANHQQWFIMVVEAEGKSFIIADDEDDPIVSDELETLFRTLRQLGFRKASVSL